MMQAAIRTQPIAEPMAWVSRSVIFTYQVHFPLPMTSGTRHSCPSYSFRFSAKYTDAETGLLNYGRRYLQPPTGRWLSRDPIGESGGLNLNVLTRNDPVMRTDSLGLDVWSDLGAMVGSPPPLPPEYHGDGSGTPVVAQVQTKRWGGPDVKVAVNWVLGDIDRVWSTKWNSGDKCSACVMMYSPTDGWDIRKLRDKALGGYSPDNKYDLTAAEIVSFQGKLYWSGAVNYAMWGRINRLCYDYLGLPIHNLAGAKAMAYLFKRAAGYGTGQDSQAFAFIEFGYTGGLGQTTAISEYVPASGLVSRTDEKLQWAWKH